MPRVRQRKTTKGRTDLSTYKQAYEDVKAGSSLRTAAEKNGLNHSSLFRYIRKRDAAGNDENQEMGYKAHNRVFTQEQERELSKYLIRCADIYFGLAKKDVMKLAYELTIKYDLSRPRTWDDNEMAGEEWFRMFMKRKTQRVALLMFATIVTPNDLLTIEVFLFKILIDKVNVFCFYSL